MRCPRCGCQEDKVIDSRATKEGAAVRRRRECASCGYRFTTCEELVPAELKVIKRDGSKEDFDREKIRLGIKKACWKREIPDEAINELLSGIVNELESAYEKEVPSSEVGNRVMAGLRALDKVAYVRFASVYRDFKDIDEFIAEIRSMDRRRNASESGEKKKQAPCLPR